MIFSLQIWDLNLLKTYLVIEMLYEIRLQRIFKVYE